MKTKNNILNIVNRKIKFEYNFIQTISSGIVLYGTEIKPIRNGNVTLSESFCFFDNGELFINGLHISTSSSPFSHKPNRHKKLLLKKKELLKLKNELKNGLTILPYRLYENNRGVIKIDIVLCKGKKLWDKRLSLKNKEIKKEIKSLI